MSKSVRFKFDGSSSLHKPGEMSSQEEILYELEGPILANRILNNISPSSSPNKHIDVDNYEIIDGISMITMIRDIDTPERVCCDHMEENNNTTCVTSDT